jgi:hypothetical protein
MTVKSTEEDLNYKPYLAVPTMSDISDNLNFLFLFELRPEWFPVREFGDKRLPVLVLASVLYLLERCHFV